MHDKKRKEFIMVDNERYETLASSMRELLQELDELKLITVAVHVDLGLRRLEAMITSKSSNTDDLKWSEREFPTSCK